MNVLFNITMSTIIRDSTPDSKVHGANMDPICGRQDPGGPRVGHMNFAIWDLLHVHTTLYVGSWE